MCGDSHGLANGKKPPLGIHDHKHAELFLSEQALAIPGDGELKIFFDFFLPDSETFMPEVNFEELIKMMVEADLEDLQKAENGIAFAALLRSENGNMNGAAKAESRLTNDEAVPSPD